MTDTLAKLVREAGPNCREGALAWFLNPAPWIGPQAFLHTVFKHADVEVLEVAAARLRFPTDLVTLLARNNGARLFSGCLAVFGVVATGQLLDRSKPFDLPPLDIERENLGWRVDPDRLLVVGGYQQDGSRACIDRTDSRVLVFQRGAKLPSVAFANLEEWISREIGRYRELHDDEGRPIAIQELLGPPRPTPSP